MMKINAKGMMNYALGSAFYIILLTWLYPTIATNANFDEMLQSMPEVLKNMFGMQAGFGTYEAFISAEYYGLMYLIILAIFSVALSTKLIAKLVDQGSMAYLLSTPTTRVKVATTQAAVLVTGLLLIAVVTTVAGFLGNAWFLDESSAIHTSRFIQLNIVALLLFFAISGIAFLVSSLSNDEKKAMGISGMITFLSFSLDLIGKLSDKLSWLRNFSIFSLFRPGEIVNGDVNFSAVTIILLTIGIAGFATGIVGFKKRDLPL
jgi:ABC-2 type transport system permease protein